MIIDSSYFYQVNTQSHVHGKIIFVLSDTLFIGIVKGYIDNNEIIGELDMRNEVFVLVLSAIRTFKVGCQCQRHGR